MKTIKIEPLLCGHDHCTYTCFSLQAMEYHIKTVHYPEAAKNDADFFKKYQALQAMNVYGGGNDK